MTLDQASIRSQLVQQRGEPEGPVQKKVDDDGALMPRIGGAGLLQSLAEGPVVQSLGESPVQASSADGVKAAAAEGVSGGGGSLPHLDRIQQSFGHHDVSDVSAHTGSKASAANAAMGSKAYATGSSVAFKSTPDLHTAAHEAAHIIQQRQGVSLKDGVGQVGDKYEKHADKVADTVVSGKSAASMLDAGPSGGSSVQRKEEPLGVYGTLGSPLLDVQHAAEVQFGKKKLSKEDKERIKQQVKEIKDRLRQEIVETADLNKPGRSGGAVGAQLDVKLGNRLVQEANQTSDKDLADALRKEGRRLINKGKSGKHK